MSESCPFCLNPAAQHLDGTLEQLSRGWPSALVPIIQAAVIPMQQSMVDAIERGALAQGTPLPEILAARVRLYECHQCHFRMRMAQVPVDVKYPRPYLRADGRTRGRMP